MQTETAFGLKIMSRNPNAARTLPPLEAYVMSKNLSALSFHKGLEETLFEGYTSAADKHGAVTADDARRLAKDALIGEAVTLGAASFYDFLKKENAGRKTFVCNGSACLTSGRQPQVRKALEAHLPPDAIGEVCCLGRCHENGAFQHEGRNYSNCSQAQIGQIVSGAGASLPVDTYCVKSNLATPLLIAPLPDISTYYAPLLRLLRTPPETLLAELKTSGLRGRGGAGFPVAAKWASCRNAAGAHKYIICNADEGDPGAYTDRYLLEQRPHAVLFGMLLAGHVTGAAWGILYVRAEYPEACVATAKAVAELEQAGWCGENIHGSGFSFRFKVVKGAGAYICGEETALIASLEGARPEVRARPPYPAECGLFGRPTVVNNVETFACIRPVFTLGGAAFANTGTPASSGSKLTSLDGFFKRPGVYEVNMGTPLREVIEDLGGGLREPVKAIQIGGPLGGLVPKPIWDKLTFDYESFKDNGFLLGHGGMVCVPESFPMIRYLAHLFEFTAAESCGKCFPCRLGSKRGGELIERAISEKQPIDRALFNDLLETLEKGSLCALGGGLPLPIRNAMQHFSEELKPCFAGRD
jgi:NADH-quinone oxidoreductase subunit F